MVDRWWRQPHPFPPFIDEQCSTLTHFVRVREEFELRVMQPIPNAQWVAFVTWVYNGRHHLPRYWHMVWTLHPYPTLGLWRHDQDILWFNPPINLDP